MELAVKLEVFQGPLDLLLHLIEKNKIDIYDIPIVEITDQYLAYVKALGESLGPREGQTEEGSRKVMDVMSEFLLMAATLLDIKCRMLLPKEENPEEEDEEEDPRQELVERLLEYKLYKYMSYELKDLFDGADDSFYRKKHLPKEVLSFKEPTNYEELLEGISLPKLQEILDSLLKRNKEKLDPIRSRFGKIEKEEIDMEKKALYIGGLVRQKRRLGFRELLEKSGSRQEIIVAFLVILEMAKSGEVGLVQEDSGEIMITSKENEE